MSDDLSQMFTEGFWDQRYAASERVWSGNPNPRLVEQVTGLPPGTALDVGCGEGADVVWLATQGWRATGVDVSGVAVERGRRHAEQAGSDVAGRAAWQRVDVAREPLPGTFDLVTAFYVHAPPEALPTVVASLAGAVAPGGTLLVVAHHPDDEHTGIRNPQLASLLYPPEAVTALLDPTAFQVEVAEAQTREVEHHGEPLTVTDTVVRAVRRA